MTDKEFSEAKRLFLLRSELINKFARDNNLSSEAWKKIREDENYKLAEKIHKSGKDYRCSSEECEFIKVWYAKKFLIFSKEYKEKYPTISNEGCLDQMCRDLVDKLNDAFSKTESVNSVKEEVKEESMYLNEVSISNTLYYFSQLSERPDFESFAKEGLVSIVNDQIIIVTEKYFRDGKCLLSREECEAAFALEKELTAKYVEMKFVKKYFDLQENLINKARDIRRKMKEVTDTVKLSELTVELNNVYDELSRLNKEINKYVG